MGFNRDVRYENIGVCGASLDYFSSTLKTARRRGLRLRRSPNHHPIHGVPPWYSQDVLPRVLQQDKRKTFFQI